MAPPKRLSLAKNTDKSRKVKAARTRNADENADHNLPVDEPMHQEQSILRGAVGLPKEPNRASNPLEQLPMNQQSEEVPQHRNTLEGTGQALQDITRQLEGSMFQEQNIVRVRDRERKTVARLLEGEEDRQIRQQKNATRMALSRSMESAEEANARRIENASRVASKRQRESEEETAKRRKSNADRQAASRNSETDEQAARRRESNASRQAASRKSKTDEQQAEQRETNAARQAAARAVETEDQTTTRRKNDAKRQGSKRQLAKDWEMEALAYSPQKTYQAFSKLKIGEMTKECGFCHALKWEKETPSLCCNKGKTMIPSIPLPPQPLQDLIMGHHPKSKHFLINIRKYNNCFQMTSFGTTQEVHEGGFMPTFKIQGQIYHLIGSLMPEKSGEESFIQIYFMGDEVKESERRNSIAPDLQSVLIYELQSILHQNNQLIRSLKTAMSQMHSPNHRIIIRPDKIPSKEHKGRFNAPLEEEIAVLVVNEDQGSRDIILRRHDDQLKRISETHRSYDGLQYPLIYWNGQDGWHLEIFQKNPITGDVQSNKKVTCNDFYSQMFMIKSGEPTVLQRFQDLFLQFAVDMYVKIESGRLFFIRSNQAKLRAEEYIHLRDALANDCSPNDLGQRVILPSSFTGGPRYMHERTQDAMTYVRKYGKPTLFITFTCNTKWEEITNNLLNLQRPHQRQDIIARVFHLKGQQLMDLLTKGNVFGEVRCHMFTVEWQKRGLPHMHILLWLKDGLSPHDIDKFIRAEIPEKDLDEELHTIVTTNMIHGPCGAFNPKAKCMQDGKCNKKFPKQFLLETQTAIDGYPLYRRRRPEDGGQYIQLKTHQGNITIDNRWIVPYNPLLSKLFKAHINVEFCNSVKSIKYICKYVNKGSDMAVFQVNSAGSRIDEISRYQLGRYVSANEAFWRIFNFPVHQRYPPVVQLSVHLENGQRVYFTPNNAQAQVERPQQTTLTAFFKLAQEDEFASTLLYHQVPQYFRWETGTKQWIRRKEGEPVEGYPTVVKANVIGRVYTVHPSNKECFFLRLLLHQVRGPQSFQDLRKVDDTICSTYREACQKNGLLEDDDHWHKALEETAEVTSPKQLRYFFALLLTICDVSDPLQLWDTYKEKMSEDYLREARLLAGETELPYSDAIFQQALNNLEELLNNFGGKHLTDFHLPPPSREQHVARVYLQEISYNVDELTNFTRQHEYLLNQEQRIVYTTILESLSSNEEHIYFLDAPGGTGKTFLLNLLLTKIRSQKGIALAVASSGIAATLLFGGRTAHSTFKIPLNLSNSEEPTCNLSKNSAEARLLKECSFIVWDECTMTHKKALEAVNRTLQDIRQNESIMGGVKVLLAGDFRQILPVVPRGTKADELNATLKASQLWKRVKKLSLKTNMRASRSRDADAMNFATKILSLGDGKLPIDLDDSQITLPVGQNLNTEQELMDHVFPNLEERYIDQDWLFERAILAPKNCAVEALNSTLLNKLPTQERVYKSVDMMANPNEAVNYPTEFLNALSISGVPAHNLRLRIGSPVMLLRNLDPPKLCNGTRLCVRRLMNNVIEASIQGGEFKGESMFIPRIPIIPNDLPFNFKRVQFPVRLCFAMSINKAQGQSLKKVGLLLKEPCFAHGQLYVGCSRVGASDDIYTLCKDGKTRNVVYREVLI